MTIVDIIGSTGVAMLLLAFLLNIFDLISKNGHAYIWMNLTGALLSCIASILLQYMPFVILEAVWSAVSLIALLKKYFSPNVRLN